MKTVKTANELETLLKKAKVGEVSIGTLTGIEFSIEIVRKWSGPDCISIDWSDEATIRLSEPDRNQIVLELTEPSHDIVRTVWSHKDSEILKKLKRRYVLPEGTKFKRIGKFPDPRSSGAEYHYRCTVPAQRTSFLIGIDEDKRHPFISVLPTNPTTVKTAHKALRPRGIPSNVKRQGEWFFVPVTQAQRKIVGKLLVQNNFDLSSSLIDKNGDSDHDATILVYSSDGEQYVMGNITNVRHKTVQLFDWHRVVRNNEIETDRFANYD